MYPHQFHGRVNLPQPCPSPACGLAGALRLVWHPDASVHGTRYRTAAPSPTNVEFDLTGAVTHPVEVAAVLSCARCGMQIRGRLVDFDPHGPTLDTNPPTLTIRSGRFVQSGTPE